MSPPNEETPRNRRKACDLCFTKKIKCDMLEPECSNCMLYNAVCRTSIIRRMANPPRARPATKPNTSVSDNDRPVTTRLERLEKQLQKLIENTKAAHDQSASVTSPEQDATSQDTHGGGLAWTFDPMEPKLYHGPSDKNFFLPPVNDIMPIVDHYFEGPNRTCPLFCQDSIMRSITCWYGAEPKRDAPTWATLLMVVALSLRSLAPENTVCSDSIERKGWIDYCMRNTQAVMPELMTRYDDLLGVQALLALTMLFLVTSDRRPASDLLGSAMRQVHRLQLQSSQTAQYFTVEEFQQRSRVFWIAYILDKGISLRTSTPSMQLDADIDIPLPPMDPSDGAGCIWTKDGTSELNFFRMRVDLAYIQGKAYDLLYSSRAAKVQGPERKARVAHLQLMLDQWYARLPMAFKLETVSATVGDPEMVQMASLHHAYLYSTISTHGLYSHRADWRQKISSLGRTALQDFAVAMHGPRIASCSQNQNPPQADGWSSCVTIARGYLKLLQDVTPTDSLIWQCSCAHLSGLIVILANIALFPTHQYMSLDLEIARKSRQLFDQIHEVIESPAYCSLYTVIDELFNNATKVVDEAQLGRLDGTDTAISASGTGLEVDIFTETSAFPEFEYDEGQLDNLEFDSMFNPFIGENWVTSPPLRASGTEMTL